MTFLFPVSRVQKRYNILLVFSINGSQSGALSSNRGGRYLALARNIFLGVDIDLGGAVAVLLFFFLVVEFFRFSKLFQHFCELKLVRIGEFCVMKLELGNFFDLVLDNSLELWLTLLHNINLCRYRFRIFLEIWNRLLQV